MRMMADPGRRGLTAVIADTLTRKAIMAALSLRRCYATTGPRVQLSFTINGHFMGEDIFTDVAPNIGVVFNSPVNINTVEIIKNNRMAHVAIYVNTTSGVVSWTDTNFTYSSCYYIRLRTESSGLIWSSPIWVSGANTGKPSPFQIESPSNGTKNLSLRPMLRWQRSLDTLDFGDRIKYYIYLSSDRSSLDFPTDSTYKLSYQPRSNLLQNCTYHWKVEAVDHYNNRTETSVASFYTSNDPLNSVYPTPAESIVYIPLSINENGYFDLTIYNIAGQRVSTLLKEKPCQSGSYFNVPWNCRDNQGKRVAPGVYLVRLKLENRNYTKKIVVVR